MYIKSVWVWGGGGKCIVLKYNKSTLAIPTSFFVFILLQISFVIIHRGADKQVDFQLNISAERNLITTSFFFLNILEMNQILDDELSIMNILNIVRTKTSRLLIAIIKLRARKKDIQFKHNYIFSTIFITSKMHIPLYY